MARNYRLKERGTGVTLYPETTTEQVYVPGGGNLKNLLPQMQEQINARQPSVPGKGLSANDYTDDDKAAVGEWAEAWDIFTVHGELWQPDGTVALSGSWRRSPMMPLDRGHAMTLEAIYPRIVFFDAGGKAVGHKQAAGNVIEPLTVQPEEYPANAAFFTASYNAQIKRWVYLPKNFPAHNAATAQAIQMGKVALFDDMFTQAVGSLGKVDHSHVDEDGRPTPYLCNGIWLTYEEAVRMDGFGIPTGILDRKFTGDLKCRTFYPYRRANIETSAVEAFAHNYSVEVVAGSQIKSSNLANAFMNCRSLRSVPDLDLINKGLAYGVFQGCVKLESLTITRLGGNMDVRDCPLITLESWQNVISRATNTVPITITVHPEVYAKLTDEANAEWHKVLTDALAKNISFATV